MVIALAMLINYLIRLILPL